MIDGDRHAPHPIALCITELEVGGAERMFVELASRLDRQRFAPRVYVLGAVPLAGRDELVQRLRAADVPTTFLNATRRWQAPTTVARLSACWRRERPALVQSFLFHANLAARMAARAAGVPHVICGLRVAEPTRRWRLRIDWATSGLVERYVAVSEDVAKHAVRDGGLPVDKLTVIANVSSALRLAPTRKEMGPILVDQAAQLLHAAAAALVIRVGDYDEVFVEEAGGAWASLRGLRCKSVELTERLAEVTPDYYVACGIVAAREQQIGAVWVGRERVFEVGEQHLLYSISDITANAIQRAALHETTENRARQLAIANRMGQELVGSRELHSVYQTACKYVRQLINADNFGISLYDTEKSELTAAFMMNGADEIDPSEFPPLHYTPADANYGRAKAIYTARPVVCDELGSRARAGRGHFLGQGELPETGVYVPLLVEGRVIGLMELQSYQVNIYNQNEADFLSMLANQVGLAIMNARLFDETQRQLRQLTSLRAIDQTIIHNMDLSSTLKAICEQAAVQLNVEGVAVHLARGKSGVLALMACCSPDGKLMFRGKVGHTLAAWVAEKRTILTIDDMANPPEEFLGDESIQAVHEAGIQKYVGIPLESKNMFEGVMELYGSDARRMDREWLEFSITIAGQLSIAVENAILFSDLQQSNRELAEAYDATIEGWSRALDLRDKETEGHTRRVTDMTLRLAEAMGVSGEERVYYRRGALLHDIGKMGIPDSILLKPGSLTTEEWAIMRRHPSYAQAMLSPIPYLWQSLDIPYSHHERWDGSGYPRGLKGELIPLAARIFAVVDVWDALTSNRPYRPAWGEEEALAYIRDQAGKHFDPAVVNIFLENYPEWTKT